MSLLKIARMGHPVLRQAAEAVSDPTTPEIRRLVTDMAETMLDAPGVGLAAPQVYVPLRLFVFRAPALIEGEPDLIRVLINPVIEPVGEDINYGWEGCLSIPELRGLVPRYNTVRYRAISLEGEPIEQIASGYHARVVQHEFDHLNGVLYLDRMRDLRYLSYPENMNSFAREEDESA